MAQHTILAEIWYDGDWHEVPTYNRDEVVITRGRQDQLQRVSPTQCTFTINNRSGVYSPRNAMSPLYGKIGPNTRCRVTIDGGVEFVGEVPAWPQRWSKGEQDVWVPIDAYGIMQRLGMPGQKAVAKSVMRRFIEANPPASFWALDGGTQAEDLAAGVAGDPAAIVYGYVDPLTVMSGSGVLAPWLADGLLMDTSTFLAAPRGSVASASNWTKDLLYRIDAARGDKLSISFLMFDGGQTSTPGSTPNISVRMFGIDNGGGNAGTVKIGFPNTNTAVASATLPGTAMQGGTLHHIRVSATDNGGGTYTLASWLDGVALISASVSGTPMYGSPAVLIVDEVAGLGEHDGSAKVAVGWLSIWTSGAPALADAVDAAFGHPGEQAHDRIERICTEENIPVVITGSESQQMGPQPIDSPLEICFEAAETDLGGLYEPRDQFGLAYRCRTDMENQTAALTLTHGQKEIGSALDPIEDTDLVQNDVTVTRRGANSGRSVQETGPRNVQEPVDDPQGVGRFPVEIELNLYEDAQTVHQASWRRWVGTQSDARYPLVMVDLDSLEAQGKTALVADAVGLDLGDRLTIDSPPGFAQTDPIDLTVQGCTQRTSLARRTLEFNAAPAGAWRVFEISDVAPDANEFAGRLAGDPDAALRAAIDSEDLSLTFDPNIHRWTTTADHFDPDLKVRLGGEVIEVSTIATTAATYVAAGAASHADNAAVTPALYTGHTTDDWICVLARIRGTAGSLATPTGYELVKQVGKLYLFAKVHDGTESDPTITPSGGAAGDTVSAFTFGLRNMPITLDALSDAIVTSDTRSNSSAANIGYGAAYPYLQPGCVVLLLAGKSDDWTLVAVPSGFTEIAEPSSTTGSDQGLYAAYQIQTTPALAAEGSLVVTGGASAVSESMVLALAAGYQTMTVSARSVNGVVKSHSAGTLIEVEDALVLGL